MRKPRGHGLKVSSPLFLFTACLCVTSHLHGGMLSLCLDFGFSGVCHHAVPLDSASHDPRGGAGPCRRERITRLEMTWTVGQAPTWSWAFFPPWFGMDPADNLNLIQPVNHWSGRAWSMHTEYYQWSPEHNSNSRSYTVQAGQTLHGALVYSAADDSYTLSQTVVETGETSSQVVQCQSGKKSVVPYVVYERVFSCYTFPGDGKVSFRNIIVECDGTDCTLLQHTPRLGPYHRFSLLRKQPWSPLQVPWWFLLQRCRIPCAFQPSAQHLLLSRLRHQWQLSHRA